MPTGFPNKPKILRGAFVEYGLSIPPLILPFQFNPEQLTRNRKLSFSVPGQSQEEIKTLRKFHHQKEFRNLLKLQKQQLVDVEEESINFEIRLDATDKMNEGDPVTGLLGILPQLATLELMALPKDEGLIGSAVRKLTGPFFKKGFSFTKGENPPMVLFVWGPHRVLPVNINSMNVTEKEFNPFLNPIRAEVSVDLTVIEGPNIPYTWSKACKEGMSALNLANPPDITNLVIPE